MSLQLLQVYLSTVLILGIEQCKLQLLVPPKLITEVYFSLCVGIEISRLSCRVKNAARPWAPTVT